MWLHCMMSLVACSDEVIQHLMTFESYWLCRIRVNSNLNTPQVRAYKYLMLNLPRKLLSVIAHVHAPPLKHKYSILGLDLWRRKLKKMHAARRTCNLSMRMQLEEHAAKCVACDWKKWSTLLLKHESLIIGSHLGRVVYKEASNRNVHLENLHSCCPLKFYNNDSRQSV